MFPGSFSVDFGIRISPEKYKDVARQVSRSVFQLQMLEQRPTKNNPSDHSACTGWLIAPKYIVTAAHCYEETVKVVQVNTFDGTTIEAKLPPLHYDADKEDGPDLLLLELEREVTDAAPMKIAEQPPGNNEIVIGMGTPLETEALGGWITSAGPVRTSPDCNSAGRVCHALNLAGGMSGGPLFNENGEVVSIISSSRNGPGYDKWLGGSPFPKKALSLWGYAFKIPKTDSISIGPSPGEIRRLYDKIPGGEPENAGEYRDNQWETTDDELGELYNPFPFDQYESMDSAYKEARKGAVTIKAYPGTGGSGFIYDDTTIITAGHVAPKKGEQVKITMYDGRIYFGTVEKTSIVNPSDPLDDIIGSECDVAVIKTETHIDLQKYPTLQLGEPSSLRCGDPLVQIGSADHYNAAGYLQGLAATYMSAGSRSLRFHSPGSTGGMSGGPIVNAEGNVVSLSSTNEGVFFDGASRWAKPGPLIVRTRIPIHYGYGTYSTGPNTESIENFIETGRCL